MKKFYLPFSIEGQEFKVQLPNSWRTVKTEEDIIDWFMSNIQIEEPRYDSECSYNEKDPS